MKFSSTFTIFIFVLLILPLTVGFIVKPADSYSEEEQRNLQQFPEFGLDELLNGTFSKNINTYMNDQFPLRDTFVGIKSFAETVMLKRENNGVLRGKNDQLAVRLFAANDGKAHPLSYTAPENDLYYDEVVAGAAQSVKKLSDALTQNGIPFSLLMPPRTIDVAASAFAYPSDRSDALADRVAQLFADVNYVDMTKIFRSRYDAGEYIYYRTDHHWTALGAYYAYAEVMKSFGEEAYDLDDFNRVTVSQSFLGTTYSKSGYKDIAPDTMERLDHKTLTPSMFVTERPYDSALPRLDGFYYDGALDAKNKYPYYLGGTTQYAKVYLKDGADREKLLILGDSFALSLAPYLALHYDVEFVRLGDWSSVFASYGAPECDRVLVVWNFENLITTTDLSRIRGIAAQYGEQQ